MEFGDTRVTRSSMPLESKIGREKKTRDPNKKMIEDKLIKSTSSLTPQTSHLPCLQILKCSMVMKE